MLITVAIIQLFALVITISAHVPSYVKVLLYIVCVAYVEGL